VRGPARTYSLDMVARREAADAPEEFRRALASLRAATPRPEVVLEETPAPQRLAPHAVALTADVTTSGEDDELATGRFVLLHDPAGHEAWAGTFRVVTYVRADLEPEMAVDPLLAGVGWAWLTEALDVHGASFGAASGTVTRVASESFGAIAEDSGSAQIEIRASWTPLDDDFDAHLLAWCDLLCTTAGLPPVAPGVVTLPRRRPGVR
jgi:DUF3000 family protein